MESLEEKISRALASSALSDSDGEDPFPSLPRISSPVDSEGSLDRRADSDALDDVEQELLRYSALEDSEELPEPKDVPYGLQRPSLSSTKQSFSSYLSTPPSRRQQGIASSYSHSVTSSPSNAARDRENEKAKVFFRRDSEAREGGDMESVLSPKWVTKPGEEKLDRHTATETAMRKLVLELRELRREKSKRDTVSEAMIARAVEQAKLEMDQDFRLVVKAMLDEKSRVISTMEARVQYLQRENELERNRTQMALAEVESLWTERKTNVPRFIKGSKPAKPNVYQIQYRAPDNVVRYERSGNFAFAENDQQVSFRNKSTPSSPSFLTPPKVYTKPDKHSHSPHSQTPLHSPNPGSLSPGTPPSPPSMPLLGTTSKPPKEARSQISSNSSKTSSTFEESVTESRTKKKFPRWRRPAHVIYESLLASVPSPESADGVRHVPTVRIRSFLHQSELLPPNMVRGDLDVLLSKHAKRRNYLTQEQFVDVMADLAMGFIKAGIIAVEHDAKVMEETGEDWEWGTRAPRTMISKTAALEALGKVLFPVIDGEDEVQVR